MIRRLAIMAAVMTLFITPALAFHCPGDMKQIDAALAKNPPLTKAQMEEVKQQRAEGERLHNAGKHAQSVKVLGEAKATLGI